MPKRPIATTMDAYSVNPSYNLLYTGLTRAKQPALLVEPTKSIGFAMKHMFDRLKRTGHVFPS